MYLNIALKMLVGALGLLLIIRIIGKKAISELTPFDLIYVLVLSGMLEGSLFHEPVTVSHLIFAMILWAVIVYTIEVVLKKTKNVTKVIQGEPAVLINEGKLNMDELEKNHIDLEQLRAMLRQHGCYTLNDAYYAILEMNGGLSVIKKSEKQAPSVLLIDEGRIDHDTLEAIEKDEQWLRNELEKESYTDVDEIVYCEWLPGNQIFVSTYNETTADEKRLDG